MDRGLLVALLALQNQFLLPPQFLVGFQTWLANRTEALDQLLCHHGYITKTQRERLTQTLISILEKSHNQWQMAISENNAIGGIYSDMLALAEKDKTVLEWVKQIGASISNGSSPTEATGRARADKDPYGTIDFDNELGPYATLTGDEDPTEQ